jgi:hypothetical protein
MPGINAQQLVDLLRLYQAPPQQPPTVPGDWLGMPGPPVPQPAPGNVDPRLYGTPVVPGAGGSRMPYAGTSDPAYWRGRT